VQEALRAGGLANRHHLRRQILLGNERMPYDIGEPFHHVFKLTDVAGPLVAPEQRQRAGRETPHILAEAAREFQQKMLGQKLNVRHPAAQRRQYESEDVEPIVEILAEGVLAHGFLKVLVRRGDDAHRHRTARLAADAGHLAVLEQAQERMQDSTYFGTMMVQIGDADGMVSGAVNTTAHTIRPAFEIIKTKPDTSIVSSVFFMCLKDRILVFGDCAVNPNPTASQLADIAISSAHTARVFGVEPRVAMLSYSTGSSGKGEAVDEVIEATKLAHERAPELLLDGPIQYDAAIDPEVARTKAPTSPVAGHASVFIFPDLNTGNNTYKAVQRAANALAIGPVLQGLNKPVNDLSRGCTVPDIINTVMITAIQAQAEKGLITLK
jgi:phosphate acetyltransferase